MDDLARGRSRVLQRGDGLRNEEGATVLESLHELPFAALDHSQARRFLLASGEADVHDAIVAELRRERLEVIAER